MLLADAVSRHPEHYEEVELPEFDPGERKQLDCIYGRWGSKSWSDVSRHDRVKRVEHHWKDEAARQVLHFFHDIAHRENNQTLHVCCEGEDSYSFLNRVNTPYWASGQESARELFLSLPAEHSESQRRDFRAQLPGRHYAAWWELYLHELLLRLGYEITIHSAIEGTRRKPDFGLHRDGSELLVEASVVFSGIARGEEQTGAAPSWMLAAFEGIESPNFFVSIHDITARGDEQLKRAEIAFPVEDWLAILDPDQVTSEYKEESRFPELRIECRGWEVEVGSMARQMAL